MLRPDVIEAVREGRFHVYAVRTIDEGIAILTGRKAGEPDQDGNYAEGTVYHAVVQRLAEMAKKPEGDQEPAGSNQSGEMQSSSDEEENANDTDEKA